MQTMKLPAVFCLAFCLVACATKSDVVPAEPDYSDTSQWYIADRGAAVDVFYIVSTECDDYTLDGKPMHYADTRNDSIRTLLLGEMVGVDRLLAGGLNLFRGGSGDVGGQLLETEEAVAAVVFPYHLFVMGEQL